MAKVKTAGPFEANCCNMPKPASKRATKIYDSIRELMIRAHCADKRPAHKCAGAVTITRDTITLNCPRCGDARSTLPKAD